MNEDFIEELDIVHNLRHPRLTPIEEIRANEEGYVIIYKTNSGNLKGNTKSNKNRKVWKQNKRHSKKTRVSKKKRKFRKKAGNFEKKRKFRKKTKFREKTVNFEKSEISKTK